MAYSSNETGRFEIYLVEPGRGGGKWQVSSNVGVFPTWRADGRELFFLGRNGVMMAVSVTPGPTLQVGTPSEMFETRLELGGFRQRRYDVTPDGQKFILNRQTGSSDPAGFVAVQNWSAELRETP